MKILYLGNKLSKHGLNKTTVETLGESLLNEGFNVVSVSNKKNFFFRLIEMIFCTIFSKNVSYLLIDVYSTKAFWYAFLCSQIARLRKIKYIPILHGGNLPHRLKTHPKLCDMLFGNAFQNVAPSNYLKSEFKKNGFNNIIYIPNTIEIDKYDFKLRKEVEPKLFWVRAFASIYNPVMAVEVFKKIKEKYPEALLTMIGPDKDGSLKLTQQKARELGVDIIFNGRLTKAEWHKLSESHDIFINTTHFDNTPVSLIEAMALGLPIVSTNVGGIPYLIENNKTGLLVNDGNIVEMVEKIEQLLQNQNLANSLSVNGRVLAESFGWGNVKHLWQKLLL